MLRRILLLVIVACLLAPRVRAHDPFVAEVEAELSPGTLTVRISFTRSVAAYLAGLNSAPRLYYAPERFAADRESFERAAPALCTLELDGNAAAPLRSTADTISDEDIDVAFTVVYARPTRAASGRLVFSWLERLPPAERHRASFVLRNGSGLLAGPALLDLERPSVDFALAPEGAAASEGNRRAAGTDSSTGTSGPPRAGQAEFFKLGVEHILVGYDHLLYLAALVLGCARFRAIMAIITAFTLSHSLTLALAALGWVSPPSALVEQAIAASIVFVAVENLLLRGREPRLRQGVAFAFGLVHGFGFAGVLAELGAGAGTGATLVPLLAFNLGVEAGQLLVVALVLPLLMWARRHHGFVAYGQPVASFSVAVVGMFWFLGRI
jgi:hypothetical protein